MESSTNELRDNREMDRRTVVLKGAAVAAGALCGASALGLAGCSTPMADTGEQTSMDELMKKMQELEDRSLGCRGQGRDSLQALHVRSRRR